MHTELINRITGFLAGKGIAIVPASGLRESFLPGLELGPGCIYVDFEQLLYPGDLLHEAGHLAVTTGTQRALIGTAEIEQPWPTEGEEMAAILWSYAAMRELEIPQEVLFHADGYKGQSDWLINTFADGNYIGLPFLEWAGLAYGPQKAAEKGVEPFPKMVKWLRD